MNERVRILESSILSDDHYVLKKTTFSLRRSSGAWQTQTRETYDRGNGATVLLYNLERRSVVLVRQFRFPAFVNGSDGWLLETPAGLLEAAGPEERIRLEAEEETGFSVQRVRRVLECYMSPGSVTEKLYFFVAEYDPAVRSGAGGGLEEEGEDIETLELPIPEALARLERGEIQDAKTVILLQYAQLHLFPKETA